MPCGLCWRRYLQIHRLRLDLEHRTYSYRRGWFITPPRRCGTFDDIAGVFVDRNPALDGLAPSRLRSRVISLEFNDWPSESPHDGVFPLGFPMGPQVAAEKAADYARRLGIEAVDRTRSDGD